MDNQIDNELEIGVINGYGRACLCGISVLNPKP